ncbi:dihydrodipicolinate synthase family protein [Streptomyces sp. NL15-2K]|uniref:dihydrodipicolinate synthase family protein n=1 Tax=Streptomyces sp. NL15-2K TaxID=376149 RepID=UPI0032B001AB
MRQELHHELHHELRHELHHELRHELRHERHRRRRGVKFRSDPSTIRGSIAPVITPFTAEGAVDHGSLAGLIRFQLEAGSHGISLGGSTGEPSAQSVAERIAGMRTAVGVIDDRVPFLPGTGSHKLDQTLELTTAARELGADAALVITPYYARPTQEGLYTWYATVAREFPDLPIVAYDVPSRTAVDIAPETVKRLFTDFENFVGVKETTKDFEHFSRVLHACGRSLLVWSGIELLCLPLLAARRSRFRLRRGQPGPERGGTDVRAVGGG